MADQFPDIIKEMDQNVSKINVPSDFFHLNEYKMIFG
jgi:hypothetical protein